MTTCATKLEKQKPQYPDLFPGYTERMVSIRAKKRHDYSRPDNPYSNFDFVGNALAWAWESGVRGKHLTYIAMLAVKLARLIELTGTGEPPENESLEDTAIDMANYVLIWAEDITNRGV